MKGTTKWFNKKKGYGFITGEDDKEYFVHHTGISMDGYRALKDGQDVTFDVKESDKGLQAVNVIAS